MTVLTKNYTIVDPAGIYYGETKCWEVKTESLIDGKNHYLIDIDNNIIGGPVHVKGSSLLEKSQDFYVKQEGVIIGTACFVILSGTVLALSKNPAIATRVANLSIKAVNGLINILKSIKPQQVEEATKEISKSGGFDKISGIVPSFPDIFNKALASAGPVHDPLILDLNGDGIQTTSVENGIYFDADTNGFASKMAWISDEDGALCVDLNNNGQIDDGKELFGDHYVLNNGQLAA